MSSPKTSRSDPTIAEIHKTRQRISDAFGGDISAISADARVRQERSGRRTVSYAEPSSAPIPPGVGSTGARPGNSASLSD